MDSPASKQANLDGENRTCSIAAAHHDNLSKLHAFIDQLSPSLRLQLVLSRRIPLSCGWHMCHCIFFPQELWRILELDWKLPVRAGKENADAEEISWRRACQDPNGSQSCSASSQPYEAMYGSFLGKYLTFFIFLADPLRVFVQDVPHVDKKGVKAGASFCKGWSVKTMCNFLGVGVIGWST